MADVKWIKIVTDIFDDEKILLIESLPDAYAIIVVWFKLLCLAGKQNNSGVFIMNSKIAYTDKMLSTIFRMKETTVQLALKTFEEFGMIEIVDGVITIPNWGKHQNLDQLENKKQYMKNYMANYREKQRELSCKTNSKTNSKTNVSQADKDIDIEEDIRNKNKELDINKKDIYIAPSNFPNCSEPPIISLSLNDNSLYLIYQKDIDEWKELYQSVDILQELKKMKGWLNANPKKRKTKSGIKRFINAWLSREQDKPHLQSTATPKKDEPLKITAFDV